MGTNGINGNYSSFLDRMHQKGLKTTSLGNGEANFSDYGNALSDNIKSEILNSMGDEQGDQQLQNKIASLFGNKSVLDSSTIQSKAKAAGLKCSVEYKSTSYIVDNKLDGKYDKDVTNGKIAIYTFTDPQSGATIKIADANGNGSIEMEEVFMNEILGDVANSIGGPNAADSAQSRIQALQKQLEESQKNIDEIVNKALGLNDPKETKKTKEDEEAKLEEEKETENLSNKDEIKKSKFEEEVLKHALKAFGADANSIEVIDKAIAEIAKDYPEFDIKKLDVQELARTFKNEVEKEDQKEKELEKEKEEQI